MMTPRAVLLSSLLSCGAVAQLFVEFQDTEGDRVGMEREGNCVKLYGEGELVEPCLQSFQKHDDGRTLDLVDEHGELIATTFVPVGQESVLERVAEIFQDLLSTSHKGIEDTSAEGQEAPQEDEAEEQSQSELEREGA